MVGMGGNGIIQSICWDVVHAMKVKSLSARLLGSLRLPRH